MVTVETNFKILPFRLSYLLFNNNALIFFYWHVCSVLVWFYIWSYILSVNSFPVRRLQSKGVLIQYFPLHNKEDLKRLSFSWYKKFKLSFQPLGESLCLCALAARTLNPTPAFIIRFLIALTVKRISQECWLYKYSRMSNLVVVGDLKLFSWIILGIQKYCWLLA